MHGLAIINKAPGVTSFGVVEVVKKNLRVKKVGHFGTLDPMASGLLLLGIGKATKLFDFYVNKTKTYTGLVRFGFTTTTFDLEGEVNSEQKAVNLYDYELSSAFQKFKGRIRQRIPIFSAKKFKGKPLYHYARNGVSGIQIPETEVEIYDFQFQIKEKDLLEIRVSCSAGTYIRTLADDMGRELGVGAHLVGLKRDQIGEFLLENAFTIEQFVSEVRAGNYLKVIIPFEKLLPEMPALEVDHEGKRLVMNGVALKTKNFIKVLQAGDNNFYRIFDSEGNFLAICQIEKARQLFKPYLVFSLK